MNPSPLKPSPPRADPAAGGRVDVLGVPVDALTPADARSTAVSFLSSMRRHHIVTANALLVMEAQQNPALREACRDAALVVADSAGVAWATRALHGGGVRRYAGIDLALNLCEASADLGMPVYLLGGEPGVAKKASRFLFRSFPRLMIAGMRDGFFRDSDEPAIFADIARSRARLVLVALGMPKQEIWLHQQAAAMPPAVYIGIGGSFDVWAGRVDRAPRVMQEAGLEWLYRLGQEPQRWRRISQLPRFAIKVISRRI